jgi:hypothetical protein
MRKVPIMLVLLGMLFGASATAQAQISFTLRIGPPPPARVVRVIPRRPGAGYLWIEGYWYPVGSRYVWHAGYWTRPPYAGARWVRPRYANRVYHPGYWEGRRGRVDHDHGWDRDGRRDWDRRERGRGGRGGGGGR